jgi:hypothetical protein
MPDPINILTSKPKESDLVDITVANTDSSLFIEPEKALEDAPETIHKAQIIKYSYANHSGMLVIGFDNLGKIDQFSLLPDNLDKIEELTVICDLITLHLGNSGQLTDITNIYQNITDTKMQTKALICYLIGVVLEQNKAKQTSLDSITL